MATRTSVRWRLDTKTQIFLVSPFKTSKVIGYKVLLIQDAGVPMTVVLVPCSPVLVRFCLPETCHPRGGKGTRDTQRRSGTDSPSRKPAQRGTRRRFLSFFRA